MLRRDRRAPRLAAGARLANPGEFTFRAYLNGRIDLVQAEAVGDLIDAVTPLQARVAFDQLEGTLTARLREMDARAARDLIAPLEASLDFPDEGYHFVTPAETARALDATLAALDALLADAARGRMIREGLTVAIVGRPNAGKSSLFNRLAGAARAIVTDVPGTTRDLLTERVDVGGVPLTLVDTAGLRASAGDAIEEEGIARARQARRGRGRRRSSCSIDRVRSTDDDRRLLARHARRGRASSLRASRDLPAAWDAGAVGALEVSALTDEGIARCATRCARAAGRRARSRDRAPIANLRHAALLEKAREARGARRAAAAAAGVPEEFVLADLHEARGALRRDHGRAAAGRSAARHLRALLYWEISKSLIIGNLEIGNLEIS